MHESWFFVVLAAVVLTAWLFGSWMHGVGVVCLVGIAFAYGVQEGKRHVPAPPATDTPPDQRIRPC